MNRPLLALCLAASLPVLGASCGGVEAPLALDEPLQVQRAAFREGALPGAAPTASDAPGPRITAIESANNVLRPGQAGKRFLGRTTPDAVAMGLRFADLGTGYWLRPLDAPDPTANNEPTWEASCDFSREVPPGLHRLLFAAVDAQGRSGPQREQRVCMLPPYPDNLNACDPAIEPPAAVLSLAWDTDVDLDLVLVTPGGKTLSAKQPTTAPVSSAGVPALPPTAPGVGVLDRDSNAGCRADGLRREHVVWQSSPPPGTYFLRARLFDACGQGSARFVATLHLPEPRPEGGKRLVEKLRISGALEALQADGGAGPGLFLGQFDFR
ncbi:MAG: hypothetical protein MUF64_10630 [Polyangiaceae bacterium]|jgi:hypothetical protein|nr:hypothetical protein [Polyangiaceae bacterium]